MSQAKPRLAVVGALEVGLLEDGWDWERKERGF